MLERLKERLGKFITSSADCDAVMDEICDNNKKTVKFISLACIAIFSVLIFLGAFNLGIENDDVPLYIIAVLYSVMLLLLVSLKTAKPHMLGMLASYLTMGAVAFYGLVVSYRSPEQHTVTFIATMCVMSMTFADKPRRIGIAHIAVTAICVGMICIHKDESIRTADLTNVISLSALSFIGGLYSVNTKVHGYVIDRLYSQTLEKREAELSAVQLEAHQLLTAIKSTHDMVVSVNLTRNRYKLIGEESFVTHGDAVEGCFDEVIDIHRSRVAPEHKELYYNTFSREGLLRAYHDGKREVYLEYKQCDENGVPHWLGTHTMFIDTPYSTDITEITISQNIDGRVKKDAEVKAILEAERDKAEKAQKAKTDFLFQMSHDIRTPMNAIIGFASFIKASNDIEEIHGNYIQKLESASHQLLLLINDALEMSRIESGKLEFSRSENDITAIIDNVISVIQIQADEKGVSLNKEYSVLHPNVFCDRNHMNRVVMNLLSNAVKFTPSGGTVTVSLRELGILPTGRVELELKIRDTGIGMSPEFLEVIFEPFEREKTSTVSRMQGTGLGLAIVKRIVETAGDSISVSSRLGEGSEFTLNIKLICDDIAENNAEEMPDTEMPSEEELFLFFKGKRILLAEDNEFNLTIAEVILKNAGFAVECATDGKIAADMVRSASSPDYYDAVLMDVQMPVLNGYEATGEIRALPDGRSAVPIIALTANAFDTDRDDAFKAGMNGHIAKPIDTETLYRVLWDLLRK